MGANYESLGLTDRLQSKDSLSVKSNYTSAYAFDSSFEGAPAGQIVSGRVKGVIIINDGTNDRVMMGKLD